MRPILSLYLLLLCFALSTFASPLLRQQTVVQQATTSNDYFGNLYTYFTWNSTFWMCAMWGALWIVLTADRGFAYSSCIN